MDTVANLKEQTVTETPLLLIDVTLRDGQVERWSTHGVTVSGDAYSARVLRHNLFAIRAASDHGIDSVPKISITVANTDSHFSQIESSVGFKGAKLTATFLFYDLIQDAAASESMVVFQGLLNPPDEILEETVRLSAVNRMNMQRVLLPSARIQRHCPWSFPITQSQRQEAINGGAEGVHSRFFSCGYSAGEAGGIGNLDGSGNPFTACNLTPADCVERGMFDQDSTSNVTRRFGGIEFVPATIRVRSHTARNRHDSAPVANEARYNDFVPIIYGTGWVDPPVVFSRNDGNLTRMEVLAGNGKINQVVKVLVNNVEIPEGIVGRDMTGTGWWNLFADGGRNGGFNLNFVNPAGSPLGDPYGSMASLSVVVPNQINDGRVLPRVKLLVEGLQLETFDANGVSQGTQFSDNPVWMLLDVLRRTGWTLAEIDLGSFAEAAGFCDETIAATDNNGNPVSVKRFRCSVGIRSRRTAADVIRGIRNNARLQLTYRSDGKLAVFVENSLLLQQPTKPEGSNALNPLNGGWPAYVYADGSTPGLTSAILRKPDNSISVRLWSRAIADTPNRFSIEFADLFNEYQQDSLAVLDADDINRTRQEITGQLAADGLPTFDQAGRCLKFFLDRSLKGNRYITFETSVKALGQNVGDIITLTYVKEGFIDQPFRIIKIEPSTNYRSVRISAQIHDDAWYNDTNGQLSLIPPTRRQPASEPGVPCPLYGDEFDHLVIHFTLVGGWVLGSNVSVGQCLTENQLFDESVEDLAYVAGLSTVEAKGEFVEVALEMHFTHLPLVSRSQPALQQRGNQVNMREFLGCQPRVSRRVGDPVAVAGFLQAPVTPPAVGMDQTAWLHTVAHKTHQTRARCVGDMAQTDPPHSAAFQFHRNHNQGFAHKLSPANVLLLAAQVSLVDLDTSAQPFPSQPNHRLPQLLQHQPGRLIAAQTEFALQTLSAQPCFLGAGQPHCQKPTPQRHPRVVQDGSRSGRGLASAGATEHRASPRRPTLRGRAVRTNESRGPADADQILATGLLAGKPFSELHQMLWKVLAQLPRSSPPTARVQG